MCVLGGEKPTCIVKPHARSSQPTLACKLAWEMGFSSVCDRSRFLSCLLSQSRCRAASTKVLATGQPRTRGTRTVGSWR